MRRAGLISASYPPAVVSLFSTNLSYLLRGGVSLTAVLDLVGQSEASPRFKRLIGKLSRSVQSGKMMSSAMREQKSVFGSVSVALVAAAERDGTLGKAFDDVSKLIRSEAASRDRWVQALAYPLVLAMGVLLTLMFMVGYLVPAIEPLLMSIGEEPSTATLLLFGLASEGVSVSLGLVALPAHVLLIYALSKVSATVRFYWHRFVLSIWFVGSINRDIHYARLCRVSARLLQSGLTVGNAIDIASSSIDNYFIRIELYRLQEDMNNGNQLSQGLALCASAPSMLSALVSVAEESGDLALALQQVSEQLDQQAEIRLERFTTLAPPVLVCALGFVLLVLVLGLLVPVFNASLTMGVSL